MYEHDGPSELDKNKKRRIKAVASTLTNKQIHRG